MFIIFLLTHPVWDVTIFLHQIFSKLNISTHTSRVGCDINYLKIYYILLLISTHTSRVGCDFCFYATKGVMIVFLLTHPVWDVTEKRCIMMKLNMISTHTSRVGCDVVLVNSLWVNLNFYSHIPCGM